MSDHSPALPSSRPKQPLNDDVLWHRAALLRRHQEPTKARRACLDPTQRVTAEELSATRAELKARGLYPWIPTRADWSVVSRPGETPRDSKLPALLLVAGSPPRASSTVALVGARASDDYGLAVTRRLAQDTVAEGGTVVSGGAEGVDSEAHRATLDAGGTTIVVLAAGHDNLYPTHHRPLFADICASGGSLISAYWPTVRPQKHRFLARNRVIAGLSDVVIVTRARAKSGSLSTAKHAEELCRSLGAVPGNVGEGLSAGPHQLLASGAARAIASAQDLADALRGTRVLSPAGESKGVVMGWPVRHCGDPDPFKKSSVAGEPTEHMALDLDPNAQMVKNAVSGQTGLDLDTIAMRTGLPTSAVVASLALLELIGDVENLPGALYRASLPIPSRPR